MFRLLSARGNWAVVALGIGLLTDACSSIPKPELTIYESAKGSVYLARVEDKSFQAAHPIKLEPQLIARVLRGAYVRSDITTLQALAGRQSHAVRVFTDEDIDEFLAPLIATALGQAAPDQQVGFRVANLATTTYTQTTGGGVGSSEGPLGQSTTETTGGLMYAHGLSLHFTLTQYRHRPLKPDTIGGANRYYPDPTGVARRDFAFAPKEALRPDSYKQPNVSGDPDVTTFVIDYQALALLPEQPAAVPGVAPAAPAAAAPAVVVPHTTSELESVKESISKKDAEVEALKKEMEAIKQQLNEQQKPALPKRKSKPAAKSAEP
jgi:hypothetical protein